MRRQAEARANTRRLSELAALRADLNGIMRKALEDVEAGLEE
jgi:hypothetical protein